jgi:exopolysaccharide biosynthesis polyprenyl glycosylphosphotransferase
MKAMGHNVVDAQGIFEERVGPLLIEECEQSSINVSTGLQTKPVVKILKGLIDICGSLLGLIFLVPLFLAIAVVIKCDSPGPVLFRQTRIGLRGIPFVLLKFRSMYQNAEVEGVQWAGISDCRITRVGWWLRKSRLDELPQLINVLQRDMSLIGPRPERPHFVQELRGLIPFYDLRHTVRPGITGWAQTCFHYAASIEDSHIKLQYDLYYVKNFSIWLDFRILIRTLQVVLLGSGAR